MRKSTLSLLILVCGLLAAGIVSAQDEWPAKTHDGLELQKDTKASIVYWRPGASLAGYTKVYLVEAPVAFKKNWQRDMNTKSVSMNNRISSAEMEAIKTRLSEEFHKVFVEELEADGRLEVVDELGEDVVIIKPAIVNLVVNAPDVRNAQRSINMVTSAGEMTLYLEFVDGITGEIFGRLLDRRVDDKANFAMQANRVTNKRDADRILKSWAKELAKHIGEID